MSTLGSNEVITILLEGATELDWSLDSENSFRAENPATGHGLIISSQSHVECAADFTSLLAKTYSLSIVINPKADISDRQRTTISTGDYNHDVDQLLKNLYRRAQHLAQSKLLGDVPVSIG